MGLEHDRLGMFTRSLKPLPQISAIARTRVAPRRLQGWRGPVHECPDGVQALSAHWQPSPSPAMKVLYSLCRLSTMAVRVSNQMLRLASAMLETPEEATYGLELSKSAGLKTGTIYPALARMERAGWIESEWETERAEDLGRPRRRLYRLTGVGEAVLREAIDDQLRAIQRSSTRGVRPSPKARTA